MPTKPVRRDQIGAGSTDNFAAALGLGFSPMPSPRLPRDSFVSGLWYGAAYGFATGALLATLAIAVVVMLSR